MELKESIVWTRPANLYGRLGATCISGSKLSNLVYRHANEEKVAITPDDKTIVVFEDMSSQGDTVKRVAARIKYFVTNNSSDVTSVVWFKYYGGKEAQEELLALMERIDGANVYDAADLPEPPKNSVTGTRRPVQVRLMSYGSFDERVDLSPEEFEEGGYFIPLERMEPQIPHGYARPRDMVEVLKNCGAIPVGASVYGAPKSLWKHFEGDQWVNIYTLADETYEDQFDLEAVKRSKAIEEVIQNSFFRFLADKLNTKKLGAKKHDQTGFEIPIHCGKHAETRCNKDDPPVSRRRQRCPYGRRKPRTACKSTSF